MGHRLAVPEYGGERAPQLRLPFADMSGPIWHWDMGPCVTFNLDYYDCMEAYGPTAGKTKCKLYWDDFMECAHKSKQLDRVTTMRYERKKQFAKGLIGLGPKLEPHFATKPPDDAYLPDPMDPSP